MKKVLKGFNYVATSASGATITDSNGIVLCELSAGKQGYFVATTDTIDVGTEDISVVEIRSNFVVPHLTDAGSSGGHDFEEGMIVGIGPGTEYTDIGALISQGGLFANRQDIGQWYGSLPSLVDSSVGSSYGFFQGSSITGFHGDLPVLTNGKQMFMDCANLTSFTGTINSNVSNTMAMFARTGLTEWTNELSTGLAQSMFQGCTSLTRFAPPSRTFSVNGSAQSMFYNCSSLTTFNIDSINGMTNAQSMFQGCSHLTTFNSTIPSTCTGARYMFYGTGLTEFGVDIPQQLTDARNMFAFSTSLTTFTGELHDGCGCQQMFEGCSSLTTLWPDRTEFWQLAGCSWMFTNCTSLTEWHLSLPAGLTNVQGLLKGCTSLRNWTAQSMGGVSSAAELFMGCKLSKVSVERIVNTIPTYTSGSHPIAIGVDSTDITQAEQDAFNTTLVSKGWTVTWGRN